MRRRLYLMRHGEVSYFGPDGELADPTTVGLSAAGLAQCEAVREALAEVPFDMVVTSGLRRAEETARLVVAGREVAIEEMPELEEVRILAGETVAQLTARVIPAWERLVADDRWSDLLVVAHAVVNRALLARALGTGSEAYAHIEQDYACVNIVDLEGAHSVVRAMNVTAYDLAKTGLREGTMQIIARGGRAR